MISRPMPGEWGHGPENTSGDSVPPVIPHPDLYTNVDEEEDAVSSGYGSGAESLTTPPTKEALLSGGASVRSAGRSVLHRHTEDVGPGRQSRAGGSQASRAGSAVGAAPGPSGSNTDPDYQPDWNEVIRSSFGAPLRVPQMPPSDLQPASGRASTKKSSKGKGSTLSMGTSRSGQ
jgi:hypothetical protein